MKLLAFALLLTSSCLAADALNVRDFGAKGDAQSDDTAAFQKALDECGKSGGRVAVPAGRYVVRGHLNIPEAVALEGSFDAPARTIYTEGMLEKEKGSILLAFEGQGDENADPFITLNRASLLHGLIVFYPEQSKQKIVPYPWCVRGVGDNCSITSVLLINPYKAVDFGTHAAGRHFINGLYAQPLKTGLFIDKCFDVGRVENVHFWPFWSDSEDVHKFTRENATAFVIARTDWEYMTNCFAIRYATGYHFIAGKDGPGNAILTQCGSDIGPLAVKIDAVQAHAGVSFVNSQFMSRVDIAETNHGPVKFTNCGFWGVGDTDTHIHIRGGGQVTFTNCHFAWWGQKNPSAACVIAESGGLTLNACEFLDEGKDKHHIELREDVEAAAIYGNRFHSPPIIVNRSEGDVQMGMNVAGTGSKLLQSLDRRDADEVATLWSKRLENAPAESYPLALRLASAQALARSKHVELRRKLLESVASADRTDQSATFVARATDELALDANKPTTRPTLLARRSSDASSPTPVTFGADDASTRATIRWDDEALYLSVRAAEPHMGKLLAAQSAHDGKIWTDDSIELFLCPDGVTHRYLQMIINARGAWYDGVGTMRTTHASLWNATPEIKTSRSDRDWTIEMRLRWDQLNHAPPRAGDVWTIDLRRWRYVTGKPQYSGWAGAPLSGDTHHPEAFGFLRFE